MTRIIIITLNINYDNINEQILNLIVNLRVFNNTKYLIHSIILLMTKMYNKKFPNDI